MPLTKHSADARVNGTTFSLHHLGNSRVPSMLDRSKDRRTPLETSRSDDLGAYPTAFADARIDYSAELRNAYTSATPFLLINLTPFLQALPPFFPISPRLDQAFAHCPRFLTASARRCLEFVSQSHPPAHLSLPASPCLLPSSSPSPLPPLLSQTHTDNR